MATKYGQRHGRRAMWAAAAALAVAAILPGQAAGPTFRADYRFTGTSLSAFTPIGQADWKVQNGEIVGTPKDATGGWLLVNGAALQDLQMYAEVKCVAGCKAGYLVRAEKTPDGGMKGVLMSLTDGDLQPYLVKIDAQGREVGREPLPAPTPAAGRGGGGGGAAGAGARAGGAAAPGGGAPGGGGAGQGARAGGGGGRGPGPAPALAPEIAARLPKSLAERPTGAFVAGDYNTVELLVSENALSPKFNGGSLGGGGGANRAIPDNEKNGFGQIGLYVGGAGEARFKNFMYKDALVRAWGPDRTGQNWRAVRLDPHYYAWSAAVADFNKDGNQDVVAGAYAYFGPNFAIQRQVYTPHSFNPTAEYPQPAMVNLAYDFTGDGWPDVLSMSGNAGNGIGNLYVNPQNQSRLWPHYITIQPVGNEETLFKDIDGDGRPDLIHAGMNTLRYSTFDSAKWDPANPTAMWTTHTISEPGPWGVNIGHGLGVGDVNGDGRADYLNAYGWWEQPAKGTPEGPWTHHPTAFGRWGASQGGAGGAEICTFDVNGDGLLDAFGPMEGHGFGLAWWEQKRDANRNISFVEHIIMDNFLTKNAGDVTFTEPHAAACGDVDGDRLPDLVTGKRYMSHFGYTDPDPWGEPVIYAYRLVRNKQAPGGAEFVPELVHNRSGAGSHMVIADMNKDGMNDIVVSVNIGTYVFENLRKKPAAAPAAR
ncbi:MAG: VCBS repeat-containing protein [Acidobacteria bacterium]|nr:VCBS repeat-containing protein [Acidobacteriota bacterium]